MKSDTTYSRLTYMPYVFRQHDPSGKERKRTMTDGGERGEKRESNPKTATAAPGPKPG